MESQLEHHSYGKSSIRLTKVVRHGERHELMEFCVNILLEGDFAGSYTDGDNRKIIATDSMKNTVYVLAKENDFRTCEDFAKLSCRHFCSTYAQVSSATVSISQAKWDRMELEGRPHPHAFIGGNSEKRTCRAQLHNGKSEIELIGGLTGLQVLKTTDSEFWGFVSDRYRTLPDTRDRIFATSIDATWNYAPRAGAFDESFAAIRAAMIETFASRHSLAVQQTLLEMGEAALRACNSIESIEIKLPNQHRIPFNLEPFGIRNANDIFVPTDEPFGLITGVVKRK